MDPQVQALLQMMQAAAEASGAPPITELDPAVARANSEVSFVAFNQPMPPSVTVVDRTVPGAAGDIGAKVFTPQGEGPFPLLVYIHGGGWVICSPNTHAKLCAELSEGGGCVVVSIDYRLAPEHPAPAGLEDCVAATKWIVEHASEFNADGSRFAVGGDSAGANLTAATCIALRDGGGPKARLMLLLYGGYVGDLDTESMIRNGEGLILTRDSVRWFYGHYTSGDIKPGDPRVTPYHADLHDLPPAHLIVGTLDPLLDDSKMFAEKLQAADVPATLSVYDDMPHVFMQLSAMLDGGKKGVAEAADALKQALA